MNKVRWRALLMASAIVTVPAAAGAQVANGGGDASSDAPVGQTSVEDETLSQTGQDIVVTANKRVERLNDVGLTVSVVGGEALKQRQITSLADIAQTVPGLSYANSANGTPIYTLRGVGFIESSLGVYPTVSTYVDEVPLSFPVLSAHSAYDLERIEVLKGPQGILFGQNATGGAINFIAAKPTSTVTAGADIGYGRFNQLSAEAFLSGPITDKLKGRIAGRVEIADGWQYSNSRPGDHNGRTRNYMGRILLDFEPVDGARFLLNVNGWKDESDTQVPQYIGYQIQGVELDPDLAASPFSPKRARAGDWTPGVPFRDNSFWQVSLRGDFDLTSDITLTSLTAYAKYKQRQGHDGDGLPAMSVDLPLDLGRIKTFSQEIRVANNASAALKWIAGANYERSKVFQSISAVFIDTSIAYLLSDIGFTNFRDLTYSTDQKFRTYAFFGNAEYDIGDSGLTVKAGARYTNARFSAFIDNKDPTAVPGGIGAFYFDVLLGGRFGQYAGQPFSINNLGREVNGVAPGAHGVFAGQFKEDNISYRVGLDWQARPGLLVYANVQRGYKQGSFPTVSASVFSQYVPVTQESVQAYEAGIKASLLDRVLQLNGAAFYYDYKDKQLRSKTIDSQFGLLDVLQNVPKSSVKGLELEATVRPHRYVALTTAFTYLDATIDKFSGINSSGVTAVFDGERMPFTPKYQVGANLDTNFPLSDNLELFTGTNFAYRSSTVATIGGDINPPAATPQDFTLFGIKSYATLDLQIGLKAADDRWRVSLWGKNVTNTYYWNNTVAAVDVIVRYTGMPATYGVTASFRM